MSEIASIFNTAGVGIGLLIILLGGFMAVVGYLIKINRDTAINLCKKDEERSIEREKYENNLTGLMTKSNDVYLQVAKSNQNIADALGCIKILVDNIDKKFETHDERAISINDGVKEIKLRVENCGKGGTK